MKVKMLTSKRGSPDGLVVKTYEKDKIYKLPKELSFAFLTMGVCVVAKKPMEKPVEKPVKKVIVEMKKEKKKKWKKGKKDKS